MKLIGFDCSLENSYSQISLPLSVKELFIGSPYTWRTRACVVLPLVSCSDTDCCEASAMVSLPTLAQPLKNANESPARKQMRNTMAPLRNFLEPDTQSGSLRRKDLAISHLGLVRSLAGSCVVNNNSTPTDDCERQLPKILIPQFKKGRRCSRKFVIGMS